MKTILGKTVCLCITAMLVFAIPATSAKAAAACDTCEDLCRLMDQYQQKVKAIEMWQKYIENLRNNKLSEIKTQADLYAAYEQEFDAWLDARLPAANAPPDDFGSLPCKLKARGGGGSTRLVTSMTDCKIYNKSTGKEIKDGEKDAYETSVNCLADSNATLAHEGVHAQQCLNANEIMNPSEAEAFMNTPYMTAHSEKDAYTEHRDKLHDAIFNIISKDEEHCGLWDYSTRQEQNPGSIPDLKDIQEMSKRAWKAAAALSDGGVSPPDGGAP